MKDHGNLRNEFRVLGWIQQICFSQLLNRRENGNFTHRAYALSRNKKLNRNPFCG